MRYLNYGLREAVITGNISVMMSSLLIVGVPAVLIFGFGVITLKWKDD